MTSPIKPRTAKVRLYDDDKMQRAADLEREAKKAKAAASPLAVDQAAYMDLAREHDALVEEIENEATVIVLHSLGRRAWRSLVAEHPPRDGNDADRAVGLNEETFPDALVPISILSPTFDTPADRDDFLDSLSSADFDALYLTAFALNRGQVADPKASLVSELTPKSD